MCRCRTLTHVENRTHLQLEVTVLHISETIIVTLINLSSFGFQVVDAAARSLRMIYQSKLAPKFDFYKEENMDFLLSLLRSENENLIGLGAGVIIHSCETSDEQNILCQAGSLEKLISGLDGSINQRDASLESLATILKNNPDAVLKFVYLQNGRALRHVIELTKGRYSRTSLLACLCLTCIKITSSSYWQDVKIKIKLISILFEFLDDSGQVREEVSFAFSSLIAGKEDLQKLENAIDMFYNQPKQQSYVPHVYDKFSHTNQFKMECILFFQDVSDCLQFPIPSFKQCPEILAAAQLYREKHPPNIYKQFDGNYEKLRLYHKSKMEVLLQRQRHTAKLFEQQYQQAAKQRQFPPPPQQQHGDFVDDIVDTFVQPNQVQDQG